METGTVAQRIRTLFLGTAAQWVVLLLSLAYVAMLLTYRPEPRPPRRAKIRPNHDGFLALSYSGVRADSKGRSVGATRLEEHIDALASGGYHMITLEEAREFVLDGVPLPEKALLLTFEDGHRHTLLLADAVLAPRRLPATFFARADAIESRSFDYPSWHELRAHYETGRWSIGSRGWHARHLVELDPSGSRGPYLVSMSFLKSRARNETSAEWRARIEGDFHTAMRVLERRVPGWTPIALSFPSSDDGAAMADGGEELHRIVGELFSLAFGKTRYAFNHRSRQRTRLTRLEVDPQWTGERLVQWLDAQNARSGPLRLGDGKEWVLRFGRLSVRDDRVHLEPARVGINGGRGAEAWLAGTESWCCVDGEVTVETRPGVQSWVFLRGQPGVRYIRIGWNGHEVVAEALVVGGDATTIVVGRPPRDAERAAISFQLFERRLRIAIRGGEAPARSFAISPDFDAGMAGLGIWFLGDDRHAVTFEALSLTPRRARAALIDDIESLRGRLDDPVDVVAPRWYEANRDGDRLDLRGSPDRALGLLAAYHGASLWPVVRLRALESEDTLRLAREIERAEAESGAQGLVLDFRAEHEPVSPEFLEMLADACATPLGLLLCESDRRALPARVTEGFAWLLVRSEADVASGVSPDRLLLVDEYEH